MWYNPFTIKLRELCLSKLIKHDIIEKCGFTGWILRIIVWKPLAKQKRRYFWRRAAYSDFGYQNIEGQSQENSNLRKW